MDSIVPDLLLFVSLIAAPVILGLLLYLGLHITGREDRDDSLRLNARHKPPTSFSR